LPIADGLADIVRRRLTRDIGFDHAEATHRQLAAANGGPLGPASIASSIIETSDSEPGWRKPIDSGVIGETQAQIDGGSHNLIKAIEFEVNREPMGRRVPFGKALLMFRHSRHEGAIEQG
jgi:hypothetical protein